MLLLMPRLLASSQMPWTQKFPSDQSNSTAGVGPTPTYLTLVTAMQPISLFISLFFSPGVSKGIHSSAPSFQGELSSFLTPRFVFQVSPAGILEFLKQMARSLVWGTGQLSTFSTGLPIVPIYSMRADSPWNSWWTFFVKLRTNVLHGSR
jgi:hypothetical protein